MSLLLSMTAGDPARDPRARRLAPAADAAGLELLEVGLAGARTSGPARGRVPRELRGLVRLARLTTATLRLRARATRSLRELEPSIVHAHDLTTLPAAWL